MKQPRGRRIPVAKIATSAEVLAAIESLSGEQSHRLKTFARFRIRGLGRAALGLDYKALFYEAICSTLAGAEGGKGGRRWEKDRVSFVDHLFGAMRSISSHWLESYERQGGDLERLDCEMAREDDEGQVTYPVELAIDPSSDPFRSVSAKEVLEILDKHFEGDEDAQLVLEARKDGLTVAEMVDQLGLTKERANAALQRIRYFAKGLL